MIYLTLIKSDTIIHLIIFAFKTAEENFVPYVGSFYKGKTLDLEMTNFTDTSPDYVIDLQKIAAP